MTSQEKTALFQMRAEGATLQEIGDRYGLSKERVLQILNYTINCQEARKRKKYVYPEIRRWMFREALSQGDLAAELGVSQSMVSSYLTGKTRPGYAFICYICDKTGLDVKTAFRREPDELAGM